MSSERCTVCRRPCTSVLRRASGDGAGPIPGRRKKRTFGVSPTDASGGDARIEGSGIAVQEKQPDVFRAGAQRWQPARHMSRAWKVDMVYQSAGSHDRIIDPVASLHGGGRQSSTAGCGVEFRVRLFGLQARENQFNFDAIVFQVDEQSVAFDDATNDGRSTIARRRQACGVCLGIDAVSCNRIPSSQIKPFAKMLAGDVLRILTRF
jgi:hypothetical protein